MRTWLSMAAVLCGTLLTAAAAPAQAADSCTPAKVMVVLDKSSSMRTGTIAGRTKWDIAVTGLGQVLTSFETKAEFGLTVFPSPSACGPGVMKVTPALSTRDAIMGALSTPPPTGGYYTPMSQTLDKVAVEPSMTAGTSPKYALLITDGWQWCSPYDPATRFDGVEAIAALNAAGITTFVVGFGSDVDSAALNRMAVQAGTAIPGCDPTGSSPTDPNQCYYQVDNAAALLDTLTAISTTVTEEICDGEDNDCDGLVDEGLTRACGTDCGTGTETCNDGTWAGCTAPEPLTEVCDGVDNDCDGTTDPGCECDPGESRDCGETTTVGVCHPGTQTCSGLGQWGDCVGSVGPSTEMCDGLDNNCDGTVDEYVDAIEGLDLCGTGEVCVDGQCNPVDPYVPEPEDGDPDIYGVSGGGCADCSTGNSLSLGGAAPFLIVGLLAIGRRRRTSKR